MKKIARIFVGLIITSALVLGFLQFVQPDVGWNGRYGASLVQEYQLAAGVIRLPNVGWNS